MSRTNRTHLNHALFGIGPSTVHGGMLMSPSSSSMWGDEFDSHGMARVKRAVKRSQRQAVAAEIDAALNEAEAPDPFYVAPCVAVVEALDVEDYTAEVSYAEIGWYE